MLCVLVRLGTGERSFEVNEVKIFGNAWNLKQCCWGKVAELYFYYAGQNTYDGEGDGRECCEDHGGDV